MDWQRLLIVPVLAAIVAGLTWHYRRSAALLEDWADQLGYRIVEKHLRLLRRGPFLWTTSEGQTVYRVTVDDGRGRLRSGWVRCGHFAFGMFRSRVQVRWDDEAGCDDQPA